MIATSKMTFELLFDGNLGYHLHASRPPAVATVSRSHVSRPSAVAIARLATYRQSCLSASAMPATINYNSNEGIKQDVGPESNIKRYVEDLDYVLVVRRKLVESLSGARQEFVGSSLRVHRESAERLPRVH
uniref:Uncharacterized protein n=1 Tax=Musa acuminata TaxID=4641 RepID=Q1EPC2_MUSAC|nr:hypothetical protein MA4_78I12.42 [Musa acuminata]